MQQDQTFCFARSWQPVKFSWNLHVPNWTVYARTKLAPLVADLFLSLTPKFINKFFSVLTSVFLDKIHVKIVIFSMIIPLTLLALLFSKYSLITPALAEEVEIVAAKRRRGQEWLLFYLIGGNFRARVVTEGGELDLKLVRGIVACQNARVHGCHFSTICLEQSLVFLL